MWVKKCYECGKEYEVKGNSDILMGWCYECRAKPKPPNPYIEQRGLLVPNPLLDKEPETK